MSCRSGRIKISFLTFVFCWLTSFCFAQNFKIDSLERLLKENPNDTLRAMILNNLGHTSVREGRLKEGLEYANRSLELATKINYKKGVAAANNTIGNTYGQLGDYPKALGYLQKSLILRSEANDKVAMAASYNNIGIIYYNLSDFTKAIEYMQKALKVQDEIGNKYFVAAATGNIAVLYEKLGEDSLSYIYQMKSYEMHEAMGNKMDMVSALNNLGSLFRKKKNFEKALDYHRQSSELLNSTNDLKGLIENHSNFGLLYYDMGNFNDATSEFEKAVIFSKRLGDKKLQAEALCLLGSSNLSSSKPEDAINYYNTALAIASEIGSLEDKRVASEGLYKVYKIKKDIGKALFYHEEFTRLKDSIFNSSKNTAFNNLKTQFALDRQEQELKSRSQEQLLKKENERKQQRFINYIIIAILLIVLVFSYFLYQRFKVTNSQNRIIENQKVIVEMKNKALTDSIYYAKRIQKAHLPNDKYISKKLSELKRDGA